MKAYGLPRSDDLEHPDVADIHEYGLKTSKGGRDYHRNKARKASARRRWKRIARQKVKLEIRQAVQTILDS